MQNTPIEDNLHWLLIKASLKTKQRIMHLAEEQGMTVMQMYSLFLLEPGVQVPMNSISVLLGCDPSNVTAIVDALVAGSYIERHENTTDRRIKAIGLTHSGELFREQMLQKIQDNDVPHMSVLSKTEAKTFKSLLLKIMKAS